MNAMPQPLIFYKATNIPPPPPPMQCWPCWRVVQHYIGGEGGGGSEYCNIAGIRHKRQNVPHILARIVALALQSTFTESFILPRSSNKQLQHLMCTLHLLGLDLMVKWLCGRHTSQLIQGVGQGSTEQQGLPLCWYSIKYHLQVFRKGSVEQSICLIKNKELDLTEVYSISALKMVCKPSWCCYNNVRAFCQG